MISGCHVIIYSRDAEADRLFLRDVLQWPSVDAGEGWLIFTMPPGEVAVHPAETNDRHELYLMCDDLRGTVESLRLKDVACESVIEADWGYSTYIRLPGGGRLGLYQPRHPIAPTSRSR